MLKGLSQSKASVHVLVLARLVCTRSERDGGSFETLLVGCVTTSDVPGVRMTGNTGAVGAE